MITKSRKNAQPGAWIVNPNDRGRKAIKSGNVYLKDGDEFEIEIFNPLKVNILADIRLNGNPISSTGLIIRPGKREYLDCFIEDGHKFKFETYNVEDSKDSKDAISDNGVLEVIFYQEDIFKFNNWQSCIQTYRPYYLREYTWYDPYKQFGYNTFTRTNTTCDSNKQVFGSTLMGSLGTDFGTQIGDSSCYNTQVSNNNEIETGRVEKGSDSSQTFTQVDMDFQSTHIHSVLYKILPESQKPKEVNTKKKKTNIDTTSDAIKLLSSLGELRDKGVLTEDEFCEKKKELLSRI